VSTHDHPQSLFHARSDEEDINTFRHLRRSVVAVFLALFVTACAGGTAETTTNSGETNIVDAGSFQVQLPDEIVVVDEDQAAAETATDAVADTGEDATDALDADLVTDVVTQPEEDPDAIPLATSSDPVSELFTAFDDFQSCLERLGREFIGIPDPAIPETMDPEYLADLGACAAESGILEAQSNLEAASAERTLEEIEQWNEAILFFADCLRGRGWEVEEPVQDEFGSLQFGGGDQDGGGGFGLTPPPGEEVVDNPTLRECAADAQRLADADESEQS